MQSLYEEEIYLVSILKKFLKNIFVNNVNKIKLDEVSK